MAQREYIRLAPVRQRRRFSFVSSSRSSLWLGKDHLLLVDTEGYTESYKRFYLQDIQAIILRRNNRRLVIAVLTGLVAALLGLAAIGIDDLVGKWVFTILAGVVGLPFLLNFFYGPTCDCQLQTAVQTEDLPSLSRAPRARKMLARLRPLIAEAQGQLSPEEISTRLRDVFGAPPAATEAPPVIDSPAPPR